MITIPEHVPPEMDAEWPPDCLRLLQLAAELGTEIPQPGANLCWDILQRQTKRQPPVIKEMVRRCCHPNPAMRPSAVQLHAALSKELARAEQPLQAEEAKNEARHQIWLRLEANKQGMDQSPPKSVLPSETICCGSLPHVRLAMAPPGYLHIISP
ncbi:hypothetical protein WJX84_010984 [Apatococcus fuscideae]|uniref:Uncharacterized protein n=1 Tax=Apatococcus fuscideae TaxID=2026836 RepID=A0AAW1TCK6_9CHLO